MSTSVLFLEYPKCSTCQKAKKWLEDNAVSFQDRHIVTNTPSTEELTQWITQSGLSPQKFFNTSGLKYRSLGLKNKLETLSDTQKIALLASDGMLIRRPLVITPTGILIGFKPSVWQKFFRE